MDNLKHNQWIIFSLEKSVFAIQAHYVLEMFPLDNVQEVPQKPVYYRGVKNVRGDIIPVIDLRAIFNMPSLAVENRELINTLKAREEDHIRWLNELEQSVKEERDFKLTLDPHKCAFGKWYDSFKSDNYRVARLLERFDVPHKKIHELGHIVMQMASEGKKAEALSRIDESRKMILDRLIDLFHELYLLIENKSVEMGMVLQVDDKKVILAINEIVSVERVADDMISEIEPKSNSLVTKVCKRKSGDMVLILEQDKIFDTVEI